MYLDAFQLWIHLLQKLNDVTLVGQQGMESQAYMACDVRCVPCFRKNDLAIKKKKIKKKKKCCPHREARPRLHVGGCDDADVGDNQAGAASGEGSSVRPPGAERTGGRRRHPKEAARKRAQPLLPLVLSAYRRQRPPLPLGLSAAGEPPQCPPECPAAPCSSLRPS
jgi:hypothetical protein